MIGMTSYYDLVGDKSPSQEVLEKKWQEIKAEILKWQAKYDRPMLFTEVGYPNQEGCAKNPWNYYGSTKPDPATQAKCFQAFFNTWRDESAVGGVCIWSWRSHPDDAGGPKDISYCPVGKPACRSSRTSSPRRAPPRASRRRSRPPARRPPQPPPPPPPADPPPAGRATRRAIGS